MFNFTWHFENEAYEAQFDDNEPIKIDDIYLYDEDDIESLFNEYDIIEIVDEAFTNPYTHDKKYTALIRWSNEYLVLWVDSDFTNFDEVIPL